jgi:hypothetical protein
MPITSEPLPVLAKTDDLLELLDISEPTLLALCKTPEAHYRSFNIPKRKGGFRRIDSPQPTLQEIQSAIAEQILKKVVVNAAAHGFINGRSIISNAGSHRQGRHFLHLDIKDFFGSITRTSVKAVFSASGYEGLVADCLSRLCCANDCLPQGAPSSPPLSNLCAEEMDRALGAIAMRHGLVYTRYADDLTFSGEYIDLTLVEVVKLAVAKHGYKINDLKTLLARNGGKNIVTGISVSRHGLRVPRSFKRSVRAAAHFLIRNGVIPESRRTGGFDPFYVDRVLGRLAFWHQVEPKNNFPIEARKLIMRRLQDV